MKTLKKTQVTCANPPSPPPAYPPWRIPNKLRRQAVSRGCAATQDGTSSQAHGGCGANHHGDAAALRGEPGTRDEWDCELCTLRNSAALAACDACGTPRPPHAPGVFSTDNSLPRNGKGKAGSSAPTPYPSSRAPQVSASRGGFGSGVGGGSAGGGGVGGGERLQGRPAASTWTCRACPFAFPNSAERGTCESCGARRERLVAEVSVASKKPFSSLPSPLHTGREEAELLSSPPLPPWACGVCTVLNPGAFLACGTCEALRAFPPAGGLPERGNFAIGGGGGVADHRRGWLGGDVLAGASGSGGGGGGIGGGGGASGGSVSWDPVASFGSNPRGGGGRASGEGRRVCAVCTLENPAEAFACEACGIPLVESEAAAATVVSDGGGYSGGVPRARRRGEEMGGRGEGRHDDVDVIDLS